MQKKNPHNLGASMVSFSNLIHALQDLKIKILQR